MLFAMIGEDQKDMALLSSQERTLLNKHYNKSMMDYFSLEGKGNIHLLSIPQKIKALYDCVQKNINLFVIFLVEIVITNTVV